MEGSIDWPASFRLCQSVDVVVVLIARAAVAVAVAVASMAVFQMEGRARGKKGVGVVGGSRTFAFRFRFRLNVPWSCGPPCEPRCVVGTYREPQKDEVDPRRGRGMANKSKKFGGVCVRACARSPLIGGGSE